MATILCIEDDPFIADMYAKALQKAGHTVTVIQTGDEALDTAQHTVYDVILLDIMLPNKSGVDILEALRGEDGTKLPMTKIIITTNFDEPEENRNRLEQLADGYLIKADITPNALVDVVKQVLDQPSAD